MLNTNDQKYLEFQMQEARWLDGVVREFIPKWVQSVVEKNAQNFLGKIGHFLVDFLWIAKFQGIKISRSQDTVLPGGKGFRPNIDHGYTIAAIHTTVQRRGKEIAKKKFSVGITIKK